MRSKRILLKGCLKWDLKFVLLLRTVGRQGDTDETLTSLAKGPLLFFSFAHFSELKRRISFISDKDKTIVRNKISSGEPNPVLCLLFPILEKHHYCCHGYIYQDFLVSLKQLTCPHIDL